MRASRYWSLRRRGVLSPPPALDRPDHNVGPAPGERAEPPRPLPRDSESPGHRESLVEAEATPEPDGPLTCPDPAGVPFALPPIRVPYSRYDTRQGRGWSGSPALAAGEPLAPAQEAQCLFAR